MSSQDRLNARAVVAQALAQAARQFPRLDPTALNIDGLSGLDAKLALAIHRTALQRWITIEYLLDQNLRQPMHALEPVLRGLLLCAGAQIIFMDRLPHHAVVDESVALARRSVRAGAAGLVNAVLRRLSEMVGKPVSGERWSPALDRLPTDEGYLPLNQECLPTLKDRAVHLSVATSHPVSLIRGWMRQYGDERALALCIHGTLNPPIIVAVEEGAALMDSLTPAAPPSPGSRLDENRPLPKGEVIGTEARFMPHSLPGFIVWTGSHDELKQFLAGHRARRVQDPAAARAVAATTRLAPKCILDFCAGRGTKTRQLALLHPSATVFATDPDDARRADLRQVAGELANVQVIEPERLSSITGMDLLVLDVPCSNTGVLARRPEARYRFNPSSLRSLIALQRGIVQAALSHLSRRGQILYTTCSLEPQENRDQAGWIAEHFRAGIIHEELTLPQCRFQRGGQLKGGDYAAEADWNDGSYHALLSTAGDFG